MEKNYSEKIDDYKTIEVELQDEKINSLAGLIMQDTLNQGRTIEIPSLKIKLKRKKWLKKKFN